MEPANALCVCRSLRERKEQLQQKTDKSEYSDPDCTTGCSGMWLVVAWVWLDVRLSWLRSRAKKLFANMQNVNSFPSRLLWSFWPCGMNWIFISHVPCGSNVGFYRAEAGVEQRRLEQEQQTHKCQLNKMFRFRTGKKGAGVGTFPFPLTLSLSLCLSLSPSPTWLIRHLPLNLWPVSSLEENVRT